MDPLATGPGADWAKDRVRRVLRRFGGYQTETKGSEVEQHNTDAARATCTCACIVGTSTTFIDEESATMPVDAIAPVQLQHR